MVRKKRDVENRSGAHRLPVLPCACANLRRAARAVTRLYDQELRGTGLNVTQFTLLQALALAGEISQGRLGNVLAIDSTTLTRTLTNLRASGWISVRAGADRRVRLIALTAPGRRQLERSTPSWERAQERLRRILGEPQWDSLRELTCTVVGSAREA
jgi:DNA-binding MarR family transcriptional regulator